MFCFICTRLANILFQLLLLGSLLGLCSLIEMWRLLCPFGSLVEGRAAQVPNSPAPCRSGLLGSLLTISVSFSFLL